MTCSVVMEVETGIVSDDGDNGNDDDKERDAFRNETSGDNEDQIIREAFLSLQTEKRSLRDFARAEFRGMNAGKRGGGGVPRHMGEGKKRSSRPQ